MNGKTYLNLAGKPISSNKAGLKETTVCKSDGSRLLYYFNAGVFFFSIAAIQTVFTIQKVCFFRVI